MRHFTFFDKVRGLVDKRFSKRVRNLEIYHHLLSNKNGIEIGGPSQIFRAKGSLPLYSRIGSLDGCNYSAQTVWHPEMKEGCGQYRYEPDRTGHQYIREGTDLHGIPDGYYDFLLASHCLEHIANPLRALYEWQRVVKDEGHLLIILPHKEGTFDHRRPVTRLRHIISDYAANVQENDMTHVGEVLALHDFKYDKLSGTREQFVARSMNNVENRCLHHHVFDARQAVLLLDHAGLTLIEVDVRRPYHIVLLARKTNPARDNSVFLRMKYFAKISPFASEQIRICSDCPKCL